MRCDGDGLQADTEKASFLDKVFCVPGVYHGPLYQHARKAVGCPPMHRGATVSAPDLRAHIMDKGRDQSQANAHVSPKLFRVTRETCDRINILEELLWRSRSGNYAVLTARKR